MFENGDIKALIFTVKLFNKYFLPTTITTDIFPKGFFTGQTNYILQDIV
jgi:hypothetical protein